ncbi:alkaline phosphatase [soil metagenome]
MRRPHKPVLSLTSRGSGFYIADVKRRNQLLALFCLLVFFTFGIFYFNYWVVQKPFGIILFVGEGLDSARLAQARIYAANAETPLALDALPFTALLRNYSEDSAVPDQAAANSALATGVKVKNGALGANASGRALANLLEMARESGRMTGLVTNANLTDPGSAAFYAHQTSHDAPGLARVLVENANVDVVLGGGSLDFLPESDGGRRADERDLLTGLAEAGYELVQTREDLEEVPRWRRAKLFGVFNETELAFADEAESGAEQPTLADLVRRSIELLQYNRGGYLLVVHAGLMRKAAQENDGVRTLLETVELDRAVSIATRYAGVKSLIIVCGDVGLGGLHLNGFPPRGSGGIELLEENQTPEGPRLTWATGPNGTKPESASAPELHLQIDAFDPSFMPAPSALPAAANEPAAAFSETARPTAGDVLAFGTGLGANALHGTLENTRVFEIIRDNL